VHDLYTKFILTVIAICLIWITIKPFVITPVHADSTTKVDIVKVGGVSIYNRSLPVYIK